MILKVGADTWEVGNRGDAEPLQKGCGADTRELENLWRMHRAGSNDYFLSRLCGLLNVACAIDELDTSRSGASEGNLSNGSVGKDMVV
jgi:hypothetical protein